MPVSTAVSVGASATQRCPLDTRTLGTPLNLHFRWIKKNGASRTTLPTFYRFVKYISLHITKISRQPIYIYLILFSCQNSTCYSSNKSNWCYSNKCKFKSMKNCSNYAHFWITKIPI